MHWLNPLVHHRLLLVAAVVAAVGRVAHCLVTQVIAGGIGPHRHLKCNNNIEITSIYMKMIGEQISIQETTDIQVITNQIC